MLELANGPFVRDVSRVERGLRLQQDNMNFLIRHRHMLDAAGHDDEFAFANNGVAIAEAHPQRALDDEKQFVFVFVVMPDKFALQFHGLHVAVVYRTNNAGTAIILELPEFLREIYRIHLASLELLDCNNGRS